MPNNRSTTLAAPSALPLRILPLGDSITFGYGEPSGNSYRRNLQCLLHSLDFPTQLIGSVHHGTWPDNADDGFVLHTIADIQNASAPEITGIPDSPPNVVLVHAGTVDLDYDVAVATAPRRLKALIEYIVVALSEALVVVSQLVPNRDAMVQERINEFNKEVPRVVKNVQKESGARVVWTGMVGVTVADLLSDGTHPNAVGYSEMAKNWLLAVLAAYLKGLIVPVEGRFEDFGKTSEAPGVGCVDVS